MGVPTKEALSRQREMSYYDERSDRCIDLNELELPRVEQLGPNLYAVVFAMMKLIVARHLLRVAEAHSQLVHGGRVIESTSGNMGLALAYACREMGHTLTLVGDPGIDRSLQYRLKALGATLIIVRKRTKEGGYQQARLNKISVLLSERDNPFWTNQYQNPEAPKAYTRAAQHLHCQERPIDFLVAPVGTGSCATGLTRELRLLGHAMKLVAVDTHHSVLFGLEDGKRLLRGLGNSIHPTNLDYRLVDECHWVSAAEAFYMTNCIYSSHLLDVGPSSAAAYMVAKWLAHQNPSKAVYFVCADTGERYRLTANNPHWLSSHGVSISRIPSEPKAVTSPSHVGESWARMHWNGRLPPDSRTD